MWLISQGLVANLLEALPCRRCLCIAYIPYGPEALLVYISLMGGETTLISLIFHPFSERNYS